jgi:hypothetical protein
MLAPNETFSVSSMLALREVSEVKPKGMTKTQAEHVLSTFVCRGWLQRSRQVSIPLFTSSSNRASAGGADIHCRHELCWNWQDISPPATPMRY